MHLLHTVLHTFLMVLLERICSNITTLACKESSILKPGASGFFYRASEFCYLLARQASEVFWGIQITEEQWNQSAHQNVLGLVEMMFELVSVSFSLPKWEAVKMTFFAPCNIPSFGDHFISSHDLSVWSDSVIVGGNWIWFTIGAGF